jgi:hypothetical protein
VQRGSSKPWGHIPVSLPFGEQDGKAGEVLDDDVSV